MVSLALIREFRYEYAAVSPWSGDLDYMTAEKMNSESMSKFLKQVSQAHEEDFMLMVLDGAPSHKGKKLEVPENIGLVFLPSYSPELNPAGQIRSSATAPFGTLLFLKRREKPSLEQGLCPF